MCTETGMSDFHKMTVCVLNVHFRKLCPTKIKYRNYKNSFKSELKTSLEISEETEMTYDSFKEACSYEGKIYTGKPGPLYE